MFGLGGWELAVIAIFGFLIFGPDKLPQMARTIGRVVRQFRTAQEQMNKVIKAEVYDPLKDLEPLANPFAGISLDGKGDAKKTGSEKNTAQSSSTKKVESKSAEKDATPTKATSPTKAPVPVKDAAPKKAEDAMTSGSDSTKSGTKVVAPAAAADAAKASKEKTEVSAEKKTTESGSAGSFAQRRALLEQEHAKSKAAQTAVLTETPKDSEIPKVASAPNERKEDEKSN